MIAAAWLVAAVVLGLGIGRAIRIADERDHAPAGPAPSATDPRAVLDADVARIQREQNVDEPTARLVATSSRRTSQVIDEVIAGRHVCTACPCDRLPRHCADNCPGAMTARPAVPPC